MALATWTVRPLDPNGYYAILGLTPGRVGVDAVRHAFREAVKREKPMSPIRLSRLLQARRVLCDPVLRTQYDVLLPGQEWLDEEHRGRVQRDIVEASRVSGFGVVEVSTTVERHMEPRFTNHESRIEYRWFESEGDPLPERDSLERWVAQLATAWWSLGVVAPMLLGFSCQTPHVEHRVWGAVVMLPILGEPTAELCGELVRQAL